MTKVKTISIMQTLGIEYRDVAQVVERYFREVEAASSSLVIPIEKSAEFMRNLALFLCIN